MASLARPGGNVTGFMTIEYGIAGKWLELLKQVAPDVTRAAVLRDPTNSALIGQFAAVQGAAPSLRIEVTPIDVRDVDELERAIAMFARGPTDGMVVLGGPAANARRHLITQLAARQRIPAVYGNRIYPVAGGLISYGADLIDQSRRAADYVDRILKGEKPADLPVQAPTKYETGDQPQDRQGARPDDTAVRARPRRRGDRMRRREFIAAARRRGGVAARGARAAAGDAGDRISPRRRAG